MATEPMVPPAIEAPPVFRTWAARNWWWVLLLAGATNLAVFFLFIDGVASVISNVYRNSDAYSSVVTRLNGDPSVAAALGNPIEVGTPSGFMKANGPSGSAHFSAPVKGPRGRGTVHVTATKSADVWHYTVLEVAIEGRDERVRLLVDRDGV